MYYGGDFEFKSRLDSLLTRPERQLSMNLSCYYNHSALFIRGFEIVVSALGNVHTLDLSDSENLTDISGLGNVHTLDLDGCESITDISAH
jgi:hypothetical protein